MSRIDDLAEQYERHITTPWQRNLAGAQRIVFVVYPKEDERRLHGVGGLYGFTYLHEVLKAVEPLIRGRVVVFFPGSYDQNTYRLLDARDGWNYMATPITSLAGK